MAEIKTAAKTTGTAAAAPKTAAAVKPAAKTYKCIKQCYWKARLWKPGETITYAGEIPAKHFEEVK